MYNLKRVNTPQLSYTAVEAKNQRVAAEKATLVGMIAADHGVGHPQMPVVATVFSPGYTQCCGATHYYIAIWEPSAIIKLVLSFPKTMIFFSCQYAMIGKNFPDANGRWETPISMNDVLKGVCNTLNKEKSGIEFSYEPLYDLQGLMILNTKLPFDKFDAAMTKMKEKWGVK